MYLSHSEPVSYDALIDRSKHIRKPQGGDGDSTVFCVDEILICLFVYLFVL